ncbi:MAG: hypothetical protein JO258_06965 [Alphaproteobacteria bacterium]|nr:hypothetical protein [Alphaproteobacteria bacterium]
MAPTQRDGKKKDRPMICYPRDPNLTEALNDPLVRAVMAADGVDARKLAAELREVADRLNRFDRSLVANS